MNKSASKIKMNSRFEEMFATVSTAKGDIRKIDLTELHDFRNHPFHVDDDEYMLQLVDSIKEQGILVPGLVRPLTTGGYEIVSGHRRKRAAELAGLLEMPVEIRDMTDDEAVIAMVDANLQREAALPSEKAFALKMKMEALSHQGKRAYATSRQVVEKLLSADEVGKATGDSGRQIQRYIRLTELSKDLLDLVDQKRMKFNPAVEVSYLSKDEQGLLVEEIKLSGLVPSLVQANKLKLLSQRNACTAEEIRAIMRIKKIPERTITIRHNVLSQYFTPDYSNEQMESIIIKLLDNWKQNADRGKTNGKI